MENNNFSFFTLIYVFIVTLFLGLMVSAVNASLLYYAGFSFMFLFLIGAYLIVGHLKKYIEQPNIIYSITSVIAMVLSYYGYYVIVLFYNRTEIVGTYGLDNFNITFLFDYFTELSFYTNFISFNGVIQVLIMVVSASVLYQSLQK